MPSSPSPQPGSPRPGVSRSGVGFRERLWPSWWVWAVGLGFGMSLGLVVMRVAGPLTVALTAGVTTVLVLGLLVVWTPRIEVSDGVLRVGRAHVPLQLLDGAEALSGEPARLARGPQLDARAYLCLRGWIPAVVRIHLADPQDPTPYWLVSTRRPDALLAALGAPSAVRDEPRG